MKSTFLTYILFCFLLFPAFSAGVSENYVVTEGKKESDPENDKKEKKKNDNEDEDEDENIDEEESDSDSLSYRKLSEIIWDVNDSLANIPAYDTYCNWDNYTIHPYKFDLTKKRDTTVICLQDEHQCDYSHPVEGYITSPFGPRRGRFHYGIDIKLQTGDSVYNAFDGVVRIARRSPSYGNVVVVRHNNGLETLYAHLHQFAVEVGNPIQAGDLIGLGGNTGRSTGSHLHFELRFKGEAINPAEVICFENYILKKDTLAVHKKLFEPIIQARAAKYHVVRSGDNLGKIARRYGTSVSALCRINGIKSTTILRPGRRLRYS